LSSPASDDAWLWFMAKRFYGNGFAKVQTAMRFPSSARTATADTATAATNAVNKPAASSGGAPTGSIKVAPKGNSIIAIASRRTDAAFVKDNLP
jgi:hypothetical protein